MINLPTPIKEGYSFKGWFEDNNLSIEFISAKMPANNITLYAKWEVNEYSIDLNPNGGQLEKSTIIKQYNDPLSLPIPIKDGYNFKGWYEDSHLSIEFLSTKMPSKNIALYAKWEPQYYTVTFITNSSDQIQPQEVKFGVNATNLPIPNRDGYNFEGWYLDENHTQVFSRMPSSDVTLYAKWTIKIENKGDLLKVVDQLTTSSYKSLDKYIDIPNIQDYYRIILHNGDTLLVFYDNSFRYIRSYEDGHININCEYGYMRIAEMSIRVNRSDTWNDYFFGKDYFYDITYANEPLGITLDEFTNTRGNTEKDLLNKLINERA